MVWSLSVVLFFPPCGNLSVVSPPTVICEDVCRYMMGLCGAQWEAAVQLVKIGTSVLTNLGLTFINCSHTAEYVEPLSHCCSDSGIELCTLHLQLCQCN